MSHSLHRAVSAYLEAVKDLREVDRSVNTKFGPILDRLHAAACELLPLLEDVAPAEFIELLRGIDDDFSTSGIGTVDFGRFRAEGTRIVRELEEIQRECQSPDTSDDPAPTSPSLRLFLAEAPPHPPEPPHARLEAAARVVAEALSVARLTAEGERVFRLSGLAGFYRRPDAVPGVNANGYRWAVLRLIEAGLVAVVMADPPPVVRLSAVLQSWQRGQPVRDASGKHLPGISKQPPPVPHLRSTPELWVRWRAGCMFPLAAVPGGAKRAGNKPLEETDPAVLNVYRLLCNEDRKFEPAGGSRKGRPARFLNHLQTAPEQHQLREAVGIAGLTLTPALIVRAKKCIEKRERKAGKEKRDRR